MAITFFGVSSVPTDNGSNNTTATTITPPSSMSLGDLVVVHCTQRGTATWSVGVTGGQTWNSLGANNATTNVNEETFWARYNGTWGANPRFDSTAGTNTTVVMVVFRPTDNTYFWGANNIADNNVSGTTTVGISGVTTINPSTITLAIWSSTDDNTWGTLNGSGWSKTGLDAQYRNLSGQDSSSTFAYYIATSIVSVPSVTQTQLTLGADATATRRITFYEYIPSSVKSTFFAFFN